MPVPVACIGRRPATASASAGREFPRPIKGMTLERLLAELTALDGPVRAVYVGKAGNRYHVQGCVAERNEVIVDGAVLHMIAIEDEDPNKVISAVRAMGPRTFPISPSQGPEAGIGLPGKGTAPIYRQAVIDVGTNSVKFYVGDLASTESGRRSSIAGGHSTGRGDQRIRSHRTGGDRANGGGDRRDDRRGGPGRTPAG